MKHSIVVFLLLAVSLLVSCSSIKPPRQVVFDVTPDTVFVGDSVNIGWQMFDDNANRYRATLNDESVDIIGSSRLVPNAPKSFYRLKVFQEDSLVYSEQLSVIVKPMPVITPTPVSIPVVEEVNITPSKYAAGIINEEGRSTGAITCNVIGVDVSDFPSKVRVLVSVKDANGNLIANLAPPYNNQRSDFWKSVVETHAGKNVEIKGFTVREQRKTDTSRKSVCFVGDYSGSMTGSIGALDSAIEYGMRSLQQSDDYALVQFDHEVYRRASEVAGGVVIPRIPFEQLGGGTAFYEGAIKGLDAIRPSKKEHVAIFFTDGQDNSSYSTSATDVVRQAFNQHARTFVIAYGGADTAVLSQVARFTNGKLYQPSDASELGPIYEEILRTISSHYVIEYDGKKLGTDHNVAVTINPRNGPQYTSKSTYVEEPKIVLENRAYLAGLFNSGSSLLANPKEWDSRLSELVKLAKQYPDKSVTIRAHSDTRGDDRNNEQLSRKRALFISNELQHRGIEKSRIKIEAAGESMPIHHDDSEDWQQQENRRVEILFN